jgi:hypothetical protein
MESVLISKTWLDPYFGHCDNWHDCRGLATVVTEIQSIKSDQIKENYLSIIWHKYIFCLSPGFGGGMTSETSKCPCMTWVHIVDSADCKRGHGLQSCLVNRKLFCWIHCEWFIERCPMNLIWTIYNRQISWKHDVIDQYFRSLDKLNIRLFMRAMKMIE